MNEIQEFYDENEYQYWKIALGKELHYHTGVVGDGDIFENTIKEISSLIQENSKVLDCGCGWGGPARYLIENKNCDVTGVTISKKQYESIKDFNVVLSDMNYYTPDDHYDCAIFIESLTHMERPHEIVKNLSKNVDTIIIRDYVRSEFCPIVRNDDWNMYFRTKQDFYDIFIDSGYEIDYYKQTTPEESFNNLKSSAEIWLNNLKKIPDHAVVGQLKLLEYHCYSILYGPPITDIDFALIRAIKK